MKKQTSADFAKVDRDPFFFMGFLTLVVGTMYIITLVNAPELRQPVTFIVFTLLTGIHVILHWYLYRIAERSPAWVTGYIILQGLLAFVISVISGALGMVFALFMGLIGESVGLLGIKRWGLLALTYYLILSMICFTNLTGINSVGGYWLVTILVVIFIVIYVTMYMRQAEARTQAQELAVELEKANQQLSDYADRVEDLTISNERQRIARELHDTLSQGLAGLILQLEAADANLSNGNTDKAHLIIQHSMEQARATLDSSRRAIDDLRQPEPENLENAIRKEASRFTTSSTIPCVLHMDIEQPVKESVREAIIRSVAEALNNIAIHADAIRVEIFAVIKDDNLIISIKDDGKGFDPDQIPAGHYGILGIRERVHFVGGKVNITSSPTSGTTLDIQIPITEWEIR